MVTNLKTQKSISKTDKYKLKRIISNVGVWKWWFEREIRGNLPDSIERIKKWRENTVKENHVSSLVIILKIFCETWPLKWSCFGSCFKEMVEY